MHIDGLLSNLEVYISVSREVDNGYVIIATQRLRMIRQIAKRGTG